MSAIHHTYIIEIAASPKSRPQVIDTATYVDVYFRRVKWAEVTAGLLHNPGRDACQSLQIGLSGEAVRDYVTEWIVGLQDITSLATELATPETRDESRLPQEAPYELPDAIAKRIDIGL